MPKPPPPQQHYFTAQPATASAERTFELDLRGLTLRLTTDHGVFSRGKLDRGTQLLAKEMWIPPQGKVLDIGCGYGPLGILAAKLEPAAQVLLVDINERAVKLAQDNIALNNTPNAKAVAGDAREVVTGEFDTILCNPPIKAGKVAVMSLIEFAAGHLRPGGMLWLVIRTHNGAKTYQRDIAPWFVEVECAAIQSGYRVIVGTAKGED